MGIKDAFEQYGTSFRVVLAIDNDERTIDVHRLTFPNILVVKHRLGESYQKTIGVISRYVVPRNGNKVPSDVCLKIKKKLESLNSE